MIAEDGLAAGPDGKVRCWWPGRDPLYLAYHDNEWGRPVATDDRLYEKLCLEAFQSGLSWITILRKRENFRAAFAGFQPDQVARFGPLDVERLMNDPGIVRNRAKIEATIANAQVVERLGEDFVRLVLAHAVPDRPRPVEGTVPATSPESVAMAAALKAAGIRFVGPTTAYALM